MRTICTITVAVVLLSLSPLLAASNASLVGVPRPNAPAATPGTVSEGFLATAVLAGGTDPEGVVPCFNCVSGPDIQTLLIALPLAAVYSAQPITILLTGDDLFYGGNLPGRQGDSQGQSHRGAGSDRVGFRHSLSRHLVCTVPHRRTRVGVVYPGGRHSYRSKPATAHHRVHAHHRGRTEAVSV